MNGETLVPDARIALRVWWAYTWRVALFVGLPAWLLSAATYILRPPGAVNALLSLAFLGYMIWVQVEIFRRMLAMDFGSFGVRAVPLER